MPLPHRARFRRMFLPHCRQASPHGRPLAVLLVLLLTVSALPLAAQRYLVHTYTTKDGLPTTMVDDVAQDTSGVMWFCTRTGISRYDGHAWTHYSDRDIGGRDFLALDRDPSGRLWAISRFPGVGVFYLEGDTWRRIPSPPIPSEFRYQIRAFCSARFEGRQFLMVGVQGLGMQVWDGARWTHYDHSSGLVDDRILSAVAHRGTFWVGTARGMSVWSPAGIDTTVNRRLGLTGEPVHGLAWDTLAGSAALWVHGERWMGQWQEGAWRRRVAVAPVHPYESLAMTADHRGGVYWGAFNGGGYLSRGAKRPEWLTRASGLANRDIRAIFRDREDIIWICGPQGIDKIASRRFATYDARHGLMRDEVSAIVQSGDGALWFGHIGGLTRFDGERFTGIALSGSSDDTGPPGRILDLAALPDGTVLGAASASGIVHISPGGAARLIPVSDEAVGAVSSVLVDAAGRVWVGATAGLFRFDVRRERLEPVAMGAGGPAYIRKLFASGDTTLLIATSTSGVYRFREGSWTLLAPDSTHPQAVDIANVYAVREWRNDTLLAGTAAGLYAVHDGRYRPYPDAVHPVSRPVYFIIEDGDGRLWLGTDHGVIRFERGAMRLYTEQVGLAGTELNRSAGLVDRRGDLWFGTDQGVSRYQPAFDPVTVRPPRVTLGEGDAGPETWPLGQPVRLASDHNSPAFTFRALSFVDEQAIRFEYQLEGFDPVVRGRDRLERGRVRYIDLPPGTYRFRVRARSMTSGWSDWQVSAPIDIRPPYYRDWRFYLVIILSIVVGLVLARLLQKRRRYLSELEEEYQEQQRELRSAEARYRLLFEETTDVVFFCDPRGALIDFNSAALELLGYASRDELMAVDFRRELFWDDAEYRQVVGDLVDLGYVKNREVRMRRRDGGAISVQITAGRMTGNGGGEVFFSGIIRDITEKKRLEQQLFHTQKMESIGLLAGGIAHDFNNILSSILGYASFMKAALTADSPHMKHVEVIERSATRAAELTSQLLGFARGGKYNIQPVDINRMVQETLRIIISTIDRSIEVRRNLQPDLATVEADATQVQQVILNLCVNARDAMPDGGTLTVSTGEVLLRPEEIPQADHIKNNHFVLLRVADTGIGMDASVRERIFEPFFTTKDHGKGTGLGLAMVYGVVKNHGGFVECHSEPGMGTTFEVYFPASIHAATEVEEPAITLEKGQETLLVVDDEPLIRVFLKDALESAGYTVHLAANGVEALETFAKAPSDVDLVIMDMIMPRMGGDRAISEMYQRRPDLKVLIATGFIDTRGDKITSLRPAGVLQKPFKVSDLLTTIRQTLDSESAPEK